MAAAASQHGLCPRQLSFAGALQILEAFRWLILWSEATRQLELVTVVLAALAAHRVGHRPGRVEPRRVKRRHDKYQQLRQPRPQARAELLAGRG